MAPGVRVGRQGCGGGWLRWQMYNWVPRTSLGLVAPVREPGGFECLRDKNVLRAQGESKPRPNQTGTPALPHPPHKRMECTVTGQRDAKTTDLVLTWCRPFERVLDTGEGFPSCRVWSGVRGHEAGSNNEHCTTQVTAAAG